MDFSKFSEPQFDAKAWINAAFRLPEAQQNREETANSMVMKLQLFIGEVNKSLEETSGQILHVMPRVLREVETMQGEAVLLQNRMQAVQQDVRKVETNTTMAMDSLLKIDAQKTAIHTVEKALREMENWSHLTGDMEEVFGSGDVELMAERLRAIQNSIRVIGTKVPDYAAKADYVERLKDQFLAVVSPSLVGAFTARQHDTLLYYKGICEELGRPEELLSYYQKSLKVELNGAWAGLVESEEGLEGLWSALFDQLLSTWFDEVKWCERCQFPKPAAMVCAAVAKSLGQLEPGLEATLRDRLDLEPQKLACLIALKQDWFEKTSAFLGSLTTTLAGLGPESAALCAAAFAPLVPFIAAYQQYQQSLLLEKLNSLRLDSAELGTSVAALDAGLDGVFEEAVGAVDQCGLLTGPLGLPLLLKALRTYLDNFSSMVRRLVESARSQPLPGEPAEAKKPREEDWPRFQALLQLMRVLGRGLIRLEGLEEALQLSFAGLKEAGAAALGTSEASSEEEKREEEPFEATLLGEPTIRSAIQQLLLDHANETEPQFLVESRKQLGRVNQKALRLMTEQMYGPIDALLAPLPRLTAWGSRTVGESQAAALPSFALSPQEYITKVGAYLMSLAHQLEPLMSSEEAGFCASLAKGSLPHVKRERKPSQCEGAVGLVMESAAGGIMARFVDAASRIAQLSPPGAQQLVTDIEYLSNVVEDLGVEPTETLVSLKELLKMDKMTFEKRLESAATGDAYPSTLIGEVKAMRGL